MPSYIFDIKGDVKCLHYSGIGVVKKTLSIVMLRYLHDLQETFVNSETRIGACSISKEPNEPVFLRRIRLIIACRVLLRNVQLSAVGE